MNHDELVAEVCKVLGASPVRRGLEAFGMQIVVDASVHEPESLEEIRTLLGDCQRCKLCSGRKNIVFGVGSARPRLMVVGEAPGEQEDVLGEPFVGKAGAMLDRMLEKVLRMKREEVYITNVIRCRPPENRDPESDEVMACLPFLEMTKKVLRPEFVLLLGKVALEATLGLPGGIRSNRGKWFEWEGTPTIATFHPVYLLRQEQDKVKALEDLRMLESRLWSS
jgi:DNA polymerase